MHRKGQLSFDFYIALILFLGIIVYITFQLFQIVPTTSANVNEESVRIDAYQISELLVNDGGHPLNWNTASLTDVKRIGLSDSEKNITNYLSRLKLNRLKSICDAAGGYQEVKNKLDVQNEMSITFIEHTPSSDVTWVCKSIAPTNKEISFNVSRTVSIDGTSFGEIIVEVWTV